MTWFVEEQSFQITAFRYKKWKNASNVSDIDWKKQTNAIINSELNEKSI